MKMIERFLLSIPPGVSEAPVVLDIGSFAGDQAVEFAERFPLAHIFAFEAHPDSAEKVRQRVTLRNIEVIEAAVGEVDGDIVFQAVNQGNLGASSLFCASGHNDVSPINQTPVIVRALRLDTWAHSRAIGRCDVVWMDLQGAELLALQGMGDMIHTVKAIQLEVTYRELYHGQAMWPEVRQFLESRGLQLVDEWRDVSGYFGDAVFVRDSELRGPDRREAASTADQSERMLDHFDSPYHFGSCPNPTHAFEEENPQCGDWVRIELRIVGGDRIGAAWFQSRGCVVTKASASMLLEHLEHKSVTECANFSPADMLALFGAPLTPLRRNCCLLALRVFHRALSSPLPSR
jgi:nitrogen fixation NifU-like protein